jgi:hypothetical protein
MYYKSSLKYLLLVVWILLIQLPINIISQPTGQIEAASRFPIFLYGAQNARLFGCEFSLAALLTENLFNLTYRDHLSRVEDREFSMPGRNITLIYSWNFQSDKNQCAPMH